MKSRIVFPAALVLPTTGLTNLKYASAMKTDRYKRGREKLNKAVAKDGIPFRDAYCQ
jgi:hypothetical protein